MPQIRRASFGHTVSDAVVFAGLPHGWIDPRVGGKLCCGGKTADVSDFAEDVRAKGRADAGDGGDRCVFYFDEESALKLRDFITEAFGESGATL